MGWRAEGVYWVWSPPLRERTESLYWEGLPVCQGEGEGLSSSWILIGPGQAKVDLWVYGCHWTGFQETVIFLEVWEQLETPEVHQLQGRLMYKAAEPGGRGVEEVWVQKLCGVPAPVGWHLPDD